MSETRNAYAVTGCGNCPLAWHDEAECYYPSLCNHPDIKVQEKKIGGYDVPLAPPPDWCPLRFASLEIGLSVRVAPPPEKQS